MVDQVTLQTIGILLTGLTVSIAAIYYTLSLRYTRRNQDLQLETRQAQLFHGVFSNLDEDWWNAYHYLKSSEWTDYSDYAEKALPFNETELGRATLKVLNVLEYLGVLVKEGLVSIRLVALLISTPT